MNRIQFGAVVSLHVVSLLGCGEAEPLEENIPVASVRLFVPREGVKEFEITFEKPIPDAGTFEAYWCHMTFVTRSGRSRSGLGVLSAEDTVESWSMDSFHKYNETENRFIREEVTPGNIRSFSVVILKGAGSDDNKKIVGNATFYDL